ncbi:MAG: DUF1501 domain-containing protein [Planctomycetia bacterium]|nr:DUF1501 domain-containing protein [Planctomycetia bacterium]
MLTLHGRDGRWCDGLRRRSFLSIGGLSVGGATLSLAGILRAEEAAEAAGTRHPRRHKSLINIFLAGGPPHQDMWDLKTDAPSEIRGEFKPIATSVPGIQICEVFPRLAARADKLAIIRSVVGCEGAHAGHQSLTGWPESSLRSIGGRPSIGAAVAKVAGPVERSVPPFVGLAARTQHVPWSDAGGAGFLGPAYGAFKPDGPDLENMSLKSLPLDRLADRRRLLASMDRLRRDADATGAVEGMDAATQRAFDVLTGSKLLAALDLSKEDPRTLAAYGDGKPYRFQYDGAPTCNDHLLVARRLIEAGVRVVTLSYGRWDSHGANFDLVRDHGGKLDQCLSALVDDLAARGMLDDVTIAVWGEFGRTPKINPQAGRDHWPQVSSAVLIGGGLRTGQVIGATNRLGEHATERPVHMQEITATLYHALGIDTARTTLVDMTGRPQYLVEKLPIAELV